jgi:hypothetical protein
MRIMVESSHELLLYFDYGEHQNQDWGNHTHTQHEHSGIHFDCDWKRKLRSVSACVLTRFQVPRCTAPHTPR